MQLRWYQYFVVLAASPEVCTAAHHTEAYIHFDAQVCVASKNYRGLTRLCRGSPHFTLVATEQEKHLQTTTPIDLLRRCRLAHRLRR